MWTGRCLIQDLRAMADSEVVREAAKPKAGGNDNGYSGFCEWDIGRG